MRSLPPTLVFGPDHERLRAEIRSWVAGNDPGRAPHDFGERVAALTEWQGRLHAAGFVGLSWPEAHGGRHLGVGAEAILCEELSRSSMPELINRIALYTIAPCFMQWGSEEQLRRFLPGMLDASEIWCQGFSEPDAGSDLAGIRTRAEVDGDELVVTGQKVWTSRALWSKWCALLVRTSGSPGSHKGLSLVALDMESPGVTVAPLHQVLHEAHFSEVFLDEVRVPRANVVGPVDDGWKVAMSTMEFERGLFVLERQIALQKRLDDLERECEKRGLAAVAAERLGELRAGLDVLRAQTYRTLALQEAGAGVRGATSVDKLLLTDCYQDLFSVAFDLLGGPGQLWSDGWSHDLLESRSVSIYSGTTQVQRNIVATQLLGLPRG